MIKDKSLSGTVSQVNGRLESSQYVVRTRVKSHGQESKPDSRLKTQARNELGLAVAPTGYSLLIHFPPFILSDVLLDISFVGLVAYNLQALFNIMIEAVIAESIVDSTHDMISQLITSNFILILSKFDHDYSMLILFCLCSQFLEYSLHLSLVKGQIASFGCSRVIFTLHLTKSYNCVLFQF